MSQRAPSLTIRMKFLLTTCLLLISSSTIASAQQRSEEHASLTRGETKEAELRLSDLGYWTGSIDGLFDPATRSALIAFQKWEGRPITGRLTIDELGAIRASASPTARELGYAHVEVDLDRQVLMTINGNGGVRVLPISSGSGKPFIDEGQESISYTPRGRFVVYRKGVGWEKGALGSVYYPNDISGGVAIHGSRNVPTQPASHGCIRVPMFAAREVSKLMPLGTIVLVYDKISFVSAKEWVENPKLKQAALAISAASDEAVYKNNSKARPKSIAIKKARPKLIRAD
jgi:peptidoglycan hydrolase-like protein with peptidoglycan-binding domain